MSSGNAKRILKLNKGMRLETTGMCYKKQWQDFLLSLEKEEKKKEWEKEGGSGVVTIQAAKWPKDLPRQGHLTSNIRHQGFQASAA